ncbi:MAG: hypothetical protein GQ583_10710, partial [Methyloprofundus sp.]|nr:hypothetical protein [Methyloprofundus sp.]
SLASAGNEIITLEVCPKGTSCTKNKGNWVLYVFDSDLLTKEMEERTYEFRRWLNETGSSIDNSGQQIISGLANPSHSNHMYLAYNAGFFEGALIGVVDPCFGESNSVDIGVGDGARNYLIAISSPLKGDAGGESCGQGSVVLEKPALPANGHKASTTDENGNEIPGEVKSYPTTEEYILVSPNSDDQYAIKITGTGLNPLASGDAIANSATFDGNSGKLMLPKVRVNDQVYQATLEQQTHKARSTDDTLKFILADIQALSVEEVVDAYRATYNPENQQVLIPRVTDTSNGIGYSVILQFHAATNNGQAYFEVISATEIQ